MKVIAKCRNYSGCLKAYKGEAIELAPDAALVCPECSKPLTLDPSAGSRVAKGAGLGILALAVVGAAFYFGRPLLPSGKPGDGAAPAASTAPKNEPAPPVIDAEPAEPPASVTAPQKIDLTLASAETKRIKSEVLNRIDVMPNVTQSSKDKLYASVERARSMGKVLTVPFKSGKTTLSPEDIEALQTEIGSSAVKKLRDDATAVFVLLGFADPKGDSQKNLVVSQSRADAVLVVMRDKCGVTGVMHSVAMGASKILDTQNLEKNRIVEIWAILP
jgi:outer membrane protein OmpA-like peptidoglycan-associated protein